MHTSMHIITSHHITSHTLNFRYIYFSIQVDRDDAAAILGRPGRSVALGPPPGRTGGLDSLRALCFLTSMLGWLEVARPRVPSSRTSGLVCSFFTNALQPSALLLCSPEFSCFSEGFHRDSCLTSLRPVLDGLHSLHPKYYLCLFRTRGIAYRERLQVAGRLRK